MAVDGVVAVYTAADIPGLNRSDIAVGVAKVPFPLIYFFFFFFFLFSFSFFFFFFFSLFFLTNFQPLLLP